MASGTATTAPSTATTAPNTAPLPLTAGPSTIEPIAPIVVQLGAQDTPSVIQGARPVVSTEQTMQPAQRYGMCRMSPARRIQHPCRLRHPCRTLLLRHPCLQFPLMPNPNWMMTEREQMLQQQLLQERQQFEAWRASQAQPQPQPPISSSGLPFKVGDDVEINAGRSASAKRARPEDQVTDKVKRARSASTSRRPPSPKRGLAQPQGHLRLVLNGLSIHLLLLRTLKPLKLT